MLDVSWRSRPHESLSEKCAIILGIIWVAICVACNGMALYMEHGRSKSKHCGGWKDTEVELRAREGGRRGTDLLVFPG